jgi:hypothetical protein
MTSNAAAQLAILADAPTEIVDLASRVQSWPQRTICSKSYANRPCECRLPLAKIMKEGSARKISRNPRRGEYHAQTSVGLNGYAVGGIDDHATVELRVSSEGLAHSRRLDARTQGDHNDSVAHADV